MNNVIEIAFPLFGLGFIGYAATRLGWFPERAAEGLARFVFDYALPLMLLRVFAGADLPDVVPWDLLGSFYLPVALVYVIGVGLAAWLFRSPFMDRVTIGYACAFGNLALLGVPLTLRAFGDDGAVPALIILSVHGLCFFTVTTLLLEFGRHAAGARTELPRRMLKALVSNPLLVALMAGLVLNRTGIALPGPVDQVAGYMQQAVAPCALFSVGASLARYRIAGGLREALLVVMLKNLLVPLLVWYAATGIFALPGVWAMVVVLLAAQPTGVTVYIFAERYGVVRPQATTAVFLSTVVSLFTLPILIYVLQHTA